VISYGLAELTHALVYDLITKRWGKLKYTHVQAFTYTLPAAEITEAPKQTFALLASDGSVKVVDFSITSPASNGTIILGKYQHARSRLIQVDTVEVESIRQSQQFTLTALAALDGKNTVKFSPTLLSSVGLTRQYGCRVLGTNVSLLMQGGFSLNSLVLRFHVHGKR
jgi:hypothetical protein